MQVVTSEMAQATVPQLTSWLETHERCAQSNVGLAAAVHRDKAAMIREELRRRGVAA